MQACKEPCWDGNIYIHESKLHNKKNIKKVSTQVKGKAATPDQVADEIKYRITAYTYGERNVVVATPEEVAYMDMRIRMRPDFLESRCQMCVRQVKIDAKGHPKS